MNIYYDLIGTCTPTSYTVIYDDAKIPEDLV